MKPQLYLFLLLFLFTAFSACQEPKTITFNPDDRTATSGTQGSSKVTNQVPRRSIDTTMRKDTIGMRKE